MPARAPQLLTPRERRSVGVSQALSPKEAGETAEGAVLDAVLVLETVVDTTAEYYDARTTRPLEPRDDLAFDARITRLGAGVPVEIKTCMVVYGADQRTGVFNLRLGQHRQLLEASGVYLFAVCSPNPDRDVLGMAVLPAESVERLVSTWWDLDGRETYSQIAWTHVVPEEVVRR